MKYINPKALLGLSLATSLVMAPGAVLAKGPPSLTASARAQVAQTDTGCLKAFGHLVAPGWIKKNGTTTVGSTCTLPFGISLKLGLTQKPAKPGTTTPDTAAPVLSAISVSGISSTTATVSWTTDEPATSKVYFASGTSLDLTTATAVARTALVVGHAITLSDLSASTTYSYAVRSEDAVGNTSTSATSSFVTSL